MVGGDRNGMEGEGMEGGWNGVEHLERPDNGTRTSESMVEVGDDAGVLVGPLTQATEPRPATVLPARRALLDPLRPETKLTSRRRRGASHACGRARSRRPRQRGEPAQASRRSGNERNHRGAGLGSGICWPINRDPADVSSLGGGGPQFRGTGSGPGVRCAPAWEGRHRQSGRLGRGPGRPFGVPGWCLRWRSLSRRRERNHGDSRGAFRPPSAMAHSGIRREVIHGGDRRRCGHAEAAGAEDRYMVGGMPARPAMDAARFLQRPFS